MKRTTILLLLALVSCRHWRTVGLPSDAVCARIDMGRDECVADGKVFLCIADYGNDIMSCASIDTRMPALPSEQP